jgi:hypothetical protein
LKLNLTSINSYFLNSFVSPVNTQPWVPEWLSPIEIS